MNNNSQPSTLTKILTGFGLVSTCTFAGIALGLLFVRLFIPKKTMGWDGIADALGGVMIGALIGFVASLLLIKLLSLKQQGKGILIAALVSGITFAGLIATTPERVQTPAPTIKKAFQPTFRINMRVSHTDEILAAIPENDWPLPFVEAEVSSGKPEFIYKGWGPNFERCVATPTDADLMELVPHIKDINIEAGPFCRTPEDDLNLSASWHLAGESNNQAIQTGCLDERPAFRSMAEAIYTLASHLCNTKPGNNEAK